MTPEELAAIRARNEERKERFLHAVERALMTGSKPEPDFAIPDIDALLAEVDYLRAIYEDDVGEPVPERAR